MRLVISCWVNTALLGCIAFCAPITSAQKPSAKQTVPYRTVLVVSDASCELQLDGEGSWAISANQPKKIGIGPGQHILTCTTESGYVDHEEVDANPRSPRQVIVQVQMAQGIADAEAAKAQQEAEKAKLKEAADAEAADAKAEKEREKQVLADAHDRLIGAFSCKSTPSVNSLSGMGVMTSAFGSPTPMQTYVPVLTENDTEVSFTNGASGPLSGSLIRSTQQRLISYTEAQSRGNSFMYNFTLNPTCYTTSSGACVAESETNWTYEITGESVSDNDNEIELTLGRGECSGNCPASPYREAGKEMAIRLPRNNPGFYIGKLYCSK
jgi:hypothetical protein